MSGASRGAKNVNSFNEENSEKNAGQRLPKIIRGPLNWLNEEGAAAREDYKELRRLRDKPKYK